MDGGKERKLVTPSMVACAIFSVLVLGLSACSERSVLTGSSGDTGKSTHTVKGDLVSSTMKVWFVKTKGDSIEIVAVERRASGTDRLKQAVEDLLRGPSVEEEASGLSSEIPKGTLLLGVRSLGDDFEIDLSRRFASGGGSTSLETRLEQLKRTVSEVVGNRKVYLNVEGERLFAAAGEGLEVKQPINWN